MFSVLTDIGRALLTVNTTYYPEEGIPEMPIFQQKAEEKWRAVQTIFAKSNLSFKEKMGECKPILSDGLRILKEIEPILIPYSGPPGATFAYYLIEWPSFLEWKTDFFFFACRMETLRLFSHFAETTKKSIKEEKHKLKIVLLDKLTRITSQIAGGVGPRGIEPSEVASKISRVLLEETLDFKTRMEKLKGFLREGEKLSAKTHESFAKKKPRYQEWKYIQAFDFVLDILSNFATLSTQDPEKIVPLPPCSATLLSPSAYQKPETRCQIHASILSSLLPEDKLGIGEENPPSDLGLLEEEEFEEIGSTASTELLHDEQDGLEEFELI